MFAWRTCESVVGKRQSVFHHMCQSTVHFTAHAFGENGIHRNKHTNLVVGQLAFDNFGFGVLRVSTVTFWWYTIANAHTS